MPGSEQQSLSKGDPEAAGMGQKILAELRDVQEAFTVAGELGVQQHVMQHNQRREVMLVQNSVERVEPTRRGFGTKLIERSLVIGLSAKVNREFLETGVRCLISVPLSPDIGRIRTADS